MSQSFMNGFEKGRMQVRNSLHLQSEADVIKYAKEMEVAPPTGAKMKQVMDAIKRGATDMELIPMITGRR